MDYFGYIYLILDQKHNKVYVGQKTGKIEDSENYFGSGVIIKSIIKKRGKFFLKKIILGYCYSKEEMNEKETECKLFFNALNPIYGYNIIEKDTGGDTITNHPNKERLCKENSERQKGKRMGMENPFYGKHHTEKTIYFIKNISKDRYIGEKNPSTKLTDKIVEEIKIALRDKSFSYKELIQKYDITENILYNIKKGHSWKHIKIENEDIIRNINFNSGENHRWSKLTNQQVREIKIILRNGLLTDKEISKKYCVSEDVIYYIKKEETWRNVKI